MPFDSDPTRDLAGALSAVRFSDLAPDTVRHAQRTTLDWLGSALAGSLERPAQMAHHVACSFGASAEATMVAGGRGSAMAAAFANGVAAHILELDDIHRGSTVHGAAPIVSAALAVAEREHASGEQLITAVAAGYEAAFRIGEAVNPSHYRYWHPTGTVATFGAAVAAGSILRLNADQMIDALGTAGTQAAGLWEFNADGAMSKHLHPGKAAMNGILAADLARSGFTGARRILEGDRGFIRAMSDDADLSRLTTGLPCIGKIAENGYKLHACCGHTHTAIDLAIALRGRSGLSAADAVARVASIAIETYGPGYEIVSEARPRTPYQAKFSMAYCVAVALLEGRAGLDEFDGDRFTPEGLRDTTLAALLERTVVRVADDLTAKYPAAWPARVAVVFSDGSRLCDTSDYPRGNPENPLDDLELRQKFLDLVGPRFGVSVAERVAEAVDRLAQTPDAAALLDAVGLVARR